MSAAPAVSIVLPTYNQAGYIAEAIESVRRQTWTDWELIVIDDGSTDETRAVVAAIDEPRLRYHYQANAERSVTRNRGIEAARGRYVAFLDADDYWLPGYLATQVAVLDGDPAAGLSFTGVCDVTTAGQIIRRRWWTGATERWEFYRELLLGNRLPTPGCVLVRKACFDKGGLFNPDYRASEDWDMWLRLGLHYPIRAVPEALVCYRRYHVNQAERWHARGMATAGPRIIEALFQQPLPEDVRRRQVQALAEVLWRTAWIYYATGQVEAGRARLAEAQAIYPQRFRAPATAFVKDLVYRTDDLYDDVTPLEAALDSLNSIFSNLPASLAHVRGARRWAQGYYSGLHVFRSYERRDWPAIRRAAPVALARHPRWGLNRGFWAISLRAWRAKIAA